ncbi:MAG: flagellar hook-length control protein FliK [Clostridia bacterium]
MAYNIDLTAALKVNKQDTHSKSVDFPSKAVERPNSFRDSLKEAVRSKSLDERRTDESIALRKELVGRSEVKLKSFKKPEVKDNENAKPEVEGNETQTDKIVKTMEELLSKLEELAKLQQLGEVPPEKHAVLQQDIKEAIKELTSSQSRSIKIETPELQGKTAELQAKTSELTAVLERMLEVLKTNGSLMDKTTASNFTQEFKAIIKEIIKETAKVETTSKTPVENNSAVQVLMKEVNSADEAAISNEAINVETDTAHTAHTAKSQKMDTNIIAENKITNEPTEKQNQEMKTEAPIVDIKPVNPKTQPAAEEVTEEVKTAIGNKVEKVTVEGKESKKQDADAETQKEPAHEAPKAVNAAQHKLGNEEMAAIKLNQAAVDNQVEVVQNQVPAPKSETVNKTEVINQIVKKAELIFTDAKQEMRMQLEPDNLGKLTLKLAVEKGLITAKFVAESYEVKKIIESNFNELKDMLQEKGLEVQNFSVSVRQDNKENNNDNAFQQWKESVKLNVRSMDKGSYAGYQTGEDATASAVNPYSIHNGRFDHRA